MGALHEPGRVHTVHSCEGSSLVSLITFLAGNAAREYQHGRSPRPNMTGISDLIVGEMMAVGFPSRNWSISGDGYVPYPFPITNSDQSHSSIEEAPQKNHRIYRLYNITLLVGPVTFF